jgi:hypothetical protein
MENMTYPFYRFSSDLGLGWSWSCVGSHVGSHFYCRLYYSFHTGYNPLVELLYLPVGSHFDTYFLLYSKMWSCHIYM